MVSGRGPSAITFLFTTWIFVMLTVWLITVVLLTVTVVGWTGSRSRCSLTKTNACGATAVSRASIMPRVPIRAEGGNGAQPTYPAPCRHETQAGAHYGSGTQIQPNSTLRPPRP